MVCRPHAIRTDDTRQTSDANFGCGNNLLVESREVAVCDPLEVRAPGDTDISMDAKSKMWKAL